jgi:hypothetical protein
VPRTVRGETKEIHAEWWAEGEMCIIKRISFADRTRMNTMLWKRVGKEKAQAMRDEGAEMPEDVLQHTFLARLVVGIEFMTDPDGGPMEVTAEIVASLDDRDAQFILDAIHELNPQLTETKAERQSFQGGSGDGSEDGVDAAD